MSKIINYIKTSFQEVRENVTWSTADELKKWTISVIVGMFIFSLIVFGIDAIYGQLVQFVY